MHHVIHCHDRLPMLRDGVSGDWIGTWKGHKGAVWSCRLDPTASLAATASGDFSVQVWDAISGALIWTYPHKHIVKTCDFSFDSTQLATGGHEGIIRIYDLEQQQKQKKKQVKPLELPSIFEDKETTKVVTIGKLNWLSDTVLLAGCSDGNIRFWSLSGVLPQNVGSLKPFHTLKTEGSEVRDMELTTLPDTGKRILTVASGDKVFFFDVTNASSMTAPPMLLQVYKMPVHFRDEGGASLHPSGKKFIAGGSDLWVRVFDFATGAELECLKGHHGPIRCLRYSPDGKLYASGSEDGTIRLWQDNSAQ